MTYPCARCNMDEGSPVCLQDERCPKHGKQTYAYRGPEPDCRTCRSFYHWEDGVCKQSSKNPCINADRYQPLPPVRLWRTT